MAALPWPALGVSGDIAPASVSEREAPAPAAGKKLLPGPGPFAAPLLQGIALAADALAEPGGEVAARAGAAAPRSTAVVEKPAAERPTEPPPPLDLTSDEVVRALMKKINALSRAERFRAGRLR